MIASADACSAPPRNSRREIAMERRLRNETTIRDYLLGRLDVDSELGERMDYEMLTNAEFSEMADIIEDEIIEEYLEGKLNSADREAVEQHFLRPPERQRKLRTARLLNHYITSAVTSSGGAAQVAKNQAPRDIRPAQRLRSQVRTYIEIAAGILLVASAFHVVQLRRELQAENRQDSQKLAQERERSVALMRQLQEVRNLTQPATAMLSLLQPGVSRSNSPMPDVVVGPATKSIRVDIALPSPTPAACDVRLEIAGKVVWARDHIAVLSSSDGAILLFDLPVKGLATGEYRFVVKQGGKGEGVSYVFLINDLK